MKNWLVATLGSITLVVFLFGGLLPMWMASVENMNLHNESAALRFLETIGYTQWVLAGGDVSVGGNLYPSANNTYTLGTTTLQWQNVFSNNGTFAGTTTTGQLVDSGLTSGRIPYASTGGLLVDSANLTWNNTMLFNNSTFAGWNSSVNTTYNSLLIHGRANGLKFNLYDDARMSIWDITTFGSTPPKNPADNSSFSLSVFGDTLMGDYNTWSEATPGSGTFAGLQIGRRIGNNITDITKTTNIYSNVATTLDNSGGASITLVPDAAGVVNSGTLKLIAYGQGTGTSANAVIAYTRDGANSYFESGRFDSQGLKIQPTLSLYVGGSEVITSGKVLQNITGVWQNGTAHLSDIQMQGVSGSPVTNVSYQGFYPTTIPASTAGYLYYSSANNTFQYYNGSAWKTLAVTP